MEGRRESTFAALKCDGGHMHCSLAVCQCSLGFVNEGMIVVRCDVR
jgi:hypothetical protein